VFEHWIKFAPLMSERLGLHPKRIIQAHDIVCSVMGSAWVDENSGDKSTRSIADSHPLFTALSGRTEACILEVLHLAAYLQAFRATPGLGKSIIALRQADTYDPAIIELDVAWKFRNAGAGIRLFPITANGVADFGAVVNGVEHIVETSGFPSDPMRDGTSSFLHAMTRTFVSALRKAMLPYPMSLELDVQDVKGATREAAFAAVKQLVRTYRQGVGNGRVRNDCPFGTVAMRRSVAGEGPSVDEWTTAVRLGRSQLAKSKMFGDSDYAMQDVGSWIYLRDRTKVQDPYVRLRNKLKEEARQLSGCQSGLIILEIEVLGVGVINNRQALQPTIDDFARQHRSTTGVAIVVRPVRDNGRQRGLSGHYFPLSPRALPREFWNSVLLTDHRMNLLDELPKL
jgi:hypothetical protein